MTAIIAESMLNHPENNGLIPEEQKGNRRISRGTKDQLLIDKMILQNSKRRNTNLHVAFTKKLSIRYQTSGLRKAFKCSALVMTSDSF